MDWILLIVAGLFEIVWAVGFKYSYGFSKPLPTAITLVAMVISFWCLSQAMKTLPLGTSYAVWTGIGSAGAILFSVLWFGETLTVIKTVSFVLILLGVFGLKLG